MRELRLNSCIYSVWMRYVGFFSLLKYPMSNVIRIHRQTFLYYISIDFKSLILLEDQRKHRDNFLLLTFYHSRKFKNARHLYQVCKIPLWDNVAGNWSRGENFNWTWTCVFRLWHTCGIRYSGYPQAYIAKWTCGPVFSKSVKAQYKCKLATLQFTKGTRDHRVNRTSFFTPKDSSSSLYDVS